MFRFLPLAFSTQTAWIYAVRQFVTERLNELLTNCPIISDENKHCELCVQYRSRSAKACRGQIHTSIPWDGMCRHGLACAGWSGSIYYADTIMLVFSWKGSFIFCRLQIMVLIFHGNSMVHVEHFYYTLLPICVLYQGFWIRSHLSMFYVALFNISIFPKTDTFKVDFEIMWSENCYIGILEKQCWKCCETILNLII